MTQQTRNVGPLALRAVADPATVNVEKRTVDVVWTTGARVLRGGWFSDPFHEELSLDPKHVRMERLLSGAPFLDSHDTGSGVGAVLGVVESARLETGRGVATIRFAKAEDDPNAEKVFRKVADGVLKNISVGYRVHKMEKVEGGEGKIPVYRATDWEPYELSAVPIGADAGAQFRAESETNLCEFVEREQPDTGKEHMKTEKNTEATIQDPAAIDQTALRAEAVKAERARVSEIQRFGRAFDLDAEFVAKHVDADTSADEFRKLATDARAAAKPPIVKDQGVVVMGEDQRDKFLRGAEAWLLQRAAVADMVTNHAKKNGDLLKLDPGEFRGLGFADLARMSLERAGVRTAGMDRMKLIGLAMTHRSGFNTTGDFSVLLENTMNKTLLASYGTTPDSWSRFCAIGSVSDFRPHNRYRQGTFGRLAVVPEHAEFQNLDAPDGEKQTISATTKGNIIGLTRQALINDDMGAFTGLATMVGRAAALSIESDVFDMIKSNAGLGPLMSDGLTLFHATHANIGVGSALSADGIDADRVVMGVQEDPSGNEILDLRPETLLLAIGLGGKGRIVNESQFDPDATTNFESPNKVVGLFSQVVDSPRLTGTRRYLLASAMIAPTFEVAFLDGQRNPFLEVMNGWRVDGVEWKVRLDYGVAGVDFRGAVTNAGV